MIVHDRVLLLRNIDPYPGPVIKLSMPQRKLPSIREMKIL